MRKRILTGALALLVVGPAFAASQPGRDHDFIPTIKAITGVPAERPGRLAVGREVMQVVFRER